jgi:hypothetical protein
VRAALGVIIALGVSVAAFSAAMAANITSTVSKEGKVTISIASGIAEGDADSLKAVGASRACFF